MARRQVAAIVLFCSGLWTTGPHAHDWADEIDHFHRAEVERAFQTLEPLSVSGELRIDASAVPGYASELAYGFAMALEDWASTLDPEKAAGSEIARAVATIEVLAVLLDAGGNAFGSASLAGMKARMDGLAGSDSPADAFRVAYGYRVLSVAEDDRKAAAAFAAPFDRLRARVVKTSDGK